MHLHFSCRRDSRIASFVSQEWRVRGTRSKGRVLPFFFVVGEVLFVNDLLPLNEMLSVCVFCTDIHALIRDTTKSITPAL